MIEKKKQIALFCIHLLKKKLLQYWCNFCKLTGAYDWAKNSLKIHEGDKRDHVYTRDKLAMGKTHDPLWNAAQVSRQLLPVYSNDNYLRKLMHFFFLLPNLKQNKSNMITRIKYDHTNRMMHSKSSLVFLLDLFTIELQYEQEWCLKWWDRILSLTTLPIFWHRPISCMFNMTWLDCV